MTNIFSNKTKIVATVGPKVANPSALRKLYNAGMTIARLNGSHNNLDWHKKTIKLINKVLPNVPILFDIPGKKIRTLNLKYEHSFKKNNIITLTTNPKYNGKDKVPINNNNLHLLLKEKDRVFADDGTLKFIVTKIKNRDIYCKALNDGILKSAKGINVPHINLGADKLTKKEKKYISFALQQKVNLVGISFVENKSYIRKIKNFVKEKNIKIIAKIENQGGLNNMEGIIQISDGIMIDRGDLSIETNIESIAVFQKNIINACLKLSKPVIVATEMLDSMIEKPFPTKAEVLDISNAIIDGASCIMLSGETAVGKFPVESIRVMSSVSKKVEEKLKFSIEEKVKSIPSAIGSSIKKICETLPITKVIAITVSGYAARAVSSQMLKQPIIAVSNVSENAKSFNLYRGTKGFFAKIKFSKNSLSHVPECLYLLWKKKIINNNDIILITAVGYPSSGNRMNMIQTHYVKDLKVLFKWKKKN